MFIYTAQDILVALLAIVCLLGLLVAYALDKLYQNARWFSKWYDKKYPRKPRRY